MESHSVEPALQSLFCRCCIDCLIWKIKVLKENIPELDEFEACYMYEKFTSRFESIVRESEKKVIKVEIEKDALVVKVSVMTEEQKGLLQEIAKLKGIIKSLQSKEQDPE